MIKSIQAADTWQIRHEVMWAEMPLEYVKLKDDEKGLHCGYFIDNQLVSVISIFVDGEEMQFRKFATLLPFQGKGYGTALLHFIIEYAKSHRIKKIWCNARLDKVDFYQKFGFQLTDKIFIKEGQEYVIIELNMN